MQPMVYSFYPTGVGEKPVSPLSLSGNDVIECSTFKAADVGEGYIIRLFNPTDKNQSCEVCFMGKSTRVDFGKFEIKTLRATDKGICETDLLEGLLD